MSMMPVQLPSSRAVARWWVTAQKPSDDSTSRLTDPSLFDGQSPHVGATVPISGGCTPLRVLSPANRFATICRSRRTISGQRLHPSVLHERLCSAGRLYWARSRHSAGSDQASSGPVNVRDFALARTTRSADPGPFDALPMTTSSVQEHFTASTPIACDGPHCTAITRRSSREAL
jgi:hypothetical protein